MAKQTAVMGVSMGAICKHQGRIIPPTPRSSKMPIKCMNEEEISLTPVWPMARTFSFFKNALQKPEYKKLSASTDWQIQRNTSIILISSKFITYRIMFFDIYQKDIKNYTQLQDAASC